MNSTIRLASKLKELKQYDLAERMEKVAYTLPSGVEGLHLDEAITRLGLPPQLLQALNIQSGQPNMNMPAYRIPKERMDEANMGPGQHVKIFKNDPRSNRMRRTIGIDEDDFHDRFIALRDRYDPYTLLHEGSHAKDAEDPPPWNRLNTTAEKLSYILSDSELEAELQTMILSLYNRPSRSFAEHFQYTHKALPKESSVSTSGIQSILWKHLLKIIEEEDIYEAAKRKHEIINAAKWDFVKGPLTDFFIKKVNKGQERKALNIIDACRDVLSMDQRAFLEDIITQ